MFLRNSVLINLSFDIVTSYSKNVYMNQKINPKSKLCASEIEIMCAYCLRNSLFS